MTAARQDAWTPDDDLLLAEVTLRHIREGGTQLGAFEEVGEKLGRTAAACGFRWNSFVRKKYEAAIQIAKAQRKQRKQVNRIRPAVLPRPTGFEESAMATSTEMPNTAAVAAGCGSLEEEVSLDAVIRFLKNQKDLGKRVKQLEKELQEKEEDIHRLRDDNQRMNKELNHVQSDYQVVNEDYRTLIQIMDRARKMALLTENEDYDLKPKFKMDANGNLERVE
jgi:prespore-specific regulator